MATRTPLEWLERHGGEWWGEGEPPPVPVEHAAWAPAPTSFHEDGIDLPDFSPKTMATQFGLVSVDGGRILAFLKAYRVVAERCPHPELQCRLFWKLGELCPEYERFVGGDLARHWFTSQLRSLAEVGPALAEQLYDEGFRTPEQVLAAHRL